MRDLLTSGVKTGVQYAVAAAIGWLTGVGVNFDTEAFEIAVGSLALGATAAVLNAAGKKWPVVNTVLSFGLTRESVRYNR